MLIKILMMTEEPRIQCRVRHPEILEIVRKSFYEIEQARKIGYSWTQIKRAMRKIYPEVEQHGGYWVTRYFEKIRKELKK